MRFVALLDPSDCWVVIDTMDDVPAEFAGRVLIGLTWREARSLAAAANDKAGRREDRGQTAGSTRNFVR